jgi:hypothetical protein
MILPMTFEQRNQVYIVFLPSFDFAFFWLVICISKGLIPRALFLGEMRNISPVSFEL